MIEAREWLTDEGATKAEALVDHCKLVSLEENQGAQMGSPCATTAQGWSIHQKTRGKWREYMRRACGRVGGQKGVSIHQ